MNVRIFRMLALGAAAIAAGACAPASEDPEGDDEEMWDDGPPDGDDGAATSSEGLSTAAFQLPFRCDQVWSGQTRSNHSPVNSIDFNRDGDLGDAVVASAGGRISRVDDEGNESYGRWIEIDHGGGYTTRYAHLQSQLVSQGQSVSKGQKIGTVGNTGGSSGPHLHFELRKNGSAIKPVFNGQTALFFGTKSYTSRNCAGGGGGNDPPGVNGTVHTAGPALTIRARATANSDAKGSIANGDMVRITCQKVGQSVTGTYGTSKLWDFVGDGFVSDAFVHTGSDGRVAPDCE